MKQFTHILILLISVLSFGQNPGSISGQITDKDFNDEPLPFANVLIKGTSKGTSSDIDGNYNLENLEVGTHQIEFSFVGYETQIITITITDGDAIKKTISLGASAAQLDDVIIKTTISRETETALLLDQKKAVEIKQSIGAAELSRKGVSDAAGAVAKISGVSKQEGSSNVYVRGLGDRYLNTTFNGLSLPSNDVNKKNIDLNLFSSDVIESVSISKAYASKFYADFAAGNVDISSKSHRGKAYINVFTGSGINTNAVNKNFVRSEGTGHFGFYGRYNHNPFAVILSHSVDPENISTPINTNYGVSGGVKHTFKNDSKLSFFGTASFENNYEYRKGKAVDFALFENKRFDESEEFEYSTTTTAMGNLAYKINDKNSISFNSLFINNSSDEVGYFGTDGKGKFRDAIKDTDKGFYQQNIQFDQTKIMVNQLLGKHKSEKINIDWGIGYNNVSSHQPDRKRFSVEEYDLAFDNDATTFPTFYSNVAFDNQRYFQNITDNELNGRVNLAYQLNDKIKLNLGYNGRSKTREFDNVRYGYDILDNDYQIADVTNLNSFFNINNVDLSNSPNSDALYQIKVLTPYPSLSTTNKPASPENTYKGKLNIYAGYLDAQIKPNEKWLIVPGIRLESFEQNVNYNVTTLGNDAIGEVNSKETFFLPSLNVKYALTDAMNLRFSGSQTVSTPEFKEVAPFVYEDVTTSIGGNPDVIGFSKILNLDLKYEWFYSRSELISISVFNKTINDPVNLVIANDATGTQRFARTGNKATIYGVELEARKNIIVDEDEKSVLATGANITYMNTKQDLFEQIPGSIASFNFNRTSDELQGASPLLINADISYTPRFKNYKPTAGLIFSYFSDRIDALGSGKAGNIIENNVATLDFVLKNKIKKNFEINFSAKNLLNPSIKYSRKVEGKGDVLISSATGGSLTDYKRGINLSLQLKYKF